MEAEVKERLTGAENVRWDLSDLYAGIDDPAIDQDDKRTDDLAEQFGAMSRGKVTTLDPEEL
jgi:hypothetical protein